VREGWWGGGEREREREQRGAGALHGGGATCVTAEGKIEGGGRGTERESEGGERGNHGAPHLLDDSQKAQQTNKQASRRTSKRMNE